MPCVICNETLSVPPCKCNFPTENVNEKLFREYITIVSYDPRDVKNYVSTYKRLKNFCPCKECLVKSMCTEICQEYKDAV